MSDLKDIAIYDAERFFELPFLDITNSFDEYNPVYLFTNEQVDILLENANLSGKLLSVTASGDQILNAILKGAKEVEMFDINKFTKYFVSLKIEAIKNLNYEEFLRFYNIGIRANRNLVYNVLNQKLDYNILSKIYTKMDDNYATFFETLLSLSRHERCYNSKYYYMYNAYPSNNKYLDEEEYYKLQKLLPNVKINNFIDSDIFELKKHIGNTKYSFVLFSNISSYFSKQELERYSELLLSLEENLTDNGIIQIGYGKTDIKKYGSMPLDRKFVEEHQDKITETYDCKRIVTYYHK